MAEQSAAIDQQEGPKETPYEARLRMIAEEAGLLNVPDYRALVREFTNARLRELMKESVNDPEQFEAAYNKEIELIEAVLEKNPDTAVDMLVGRINEVPLTAPKSASKPLVQDNMLRLLVANHEKGKSGTFPWSHHRQLVDAFGGRSEDGFAGYDPRALFVQRMILNDESGRAQVAAPAPVKINPVR